MRRKYIEDKLLEFIAISICIDQQEYANSYADMGIPKLGKVKDCKLFIKNQNIFLKYKESFDENAKYDEEKMMFLYHQIVQAEWKEDIAWLEERKAVVNFCVGEIYCEKCLFEKALDYFKQAQAYIIKNSLQYTVPELFIRTKLYMAKCCLEKHSSSSVIDQLHNDAEKMLEYKMQEIDSVENETWRPTLLEYNKWKSAKLEYKMMKVELELQKAIAELDPYGEKRAEGKDEIWRFLSTQKSSGIPFENMDKNQILDVQKYLSKASELYAQIEEAESTCKYADKNTGKFSDESTWMTIWAKKQRDTLYATRASFYKEVYFDIKQAKLYYDDSTKNNKTDKEKKIMPYTERLEAMIYRKTLDRNNLDIIEMLSRESDLKKKLEYLMEDFFFEANEAFFIGWKNNCRSTICLGNLAILKYESKCNSALQKYIRKRSKHEIMRDVNTILDEVLKIEKNNMFALNMKAMLTVGKNQIDVQNTYGALRQSSLKRYFLKMSNFVGNSPDLEWIADQWKLEIILFYNSVLKYMEAAIVDTKSEKWTGRLVGHYTRKEVVSKLINKDPISRLRLSNVRHLNDPMEGISFIKVFERKERGGFEEKLLSAYSLEKQGYYRSSVYMASFTTRMDQLNMWTRYGDRGNGCCLQVDASETFDCDTKVPLEIASGDQEVVIMEDKKYPLYAVLYLPDHFCWQDNQEVMEEGVITYNQLRAYFKKRKKIEISYEEREWWGRQEHLLKKLYILRGNLINSLNRMNSFYQIVMEKAGENNELLKEAKNIIMVILDLVRFLVKSDHYREEREYRVIQYSSDPDYEEVKGNTPILFVRMQKELAYKRICYGPNVKDFNSEAAYSINIRKAPGEEKRGKNWRIEAYKSEIPYRER